MSFVKTVFGVFFLLASLSWGETPFSVAAPLSASQALSDSDPNSQESNPLLGRLKQDAVILWLRQYLGNRSSQVEKLVTPKLAETYILDYKLSQKGANKEVLELSGHLDTEALKGWLRLLETKGKGNSSIKPLVILSQSVAGLISPQPDFYTQQGTSVFTQESLQLLNQEMKKLNLKATPALVTFSSPPPRSEKEISNLKTSLGQQPGNAVIWVYLNQCRTCELPRVDIYLYSLDSVGLVSTTSEDVSISEKQLENAEKARAKLEPLFKQFQQELERAVAEGKFSALPVTITIEGIENYLAYRKIEYSLSKQNFLSDWVPRAFVQNTAQFDARTYLDSEEVARRIQGLGGQEVKLSRVRVDSRNIVMRYSP